MARVHEARVDLGGRSACAGRVARVPAPVRVSEGKQRALGDILARHEGERILVFTADNATAYAIARAFLVAPVTHEIGRNERADLLSRFRAGQVTVLVSSHVPDEGIDVPDADIAIIVGGPSSSRRHVQGIGRVLRPRGGKRALVYELVVEHTAETGYAARRRVGLDEQSHARLGDST